ncbi:MAG: hypothetical protein NC127_09280 [Muribaculum sp.]|nr:hypothetical protein [Muribaculum sp.]
MKRILLLIASVLACTLANPVDAKISEVSFINDTSGNGSKKEDPDPGRRTPPLRITGFIDWDAHAIGLPESIACGIVTYELWYDSDCILHTSNEYEVVECLGALQQSYIMIVINTLDYQLIGYYYPED